MLERTLKAAGFTVHRMTFRNPAPRTSRISTHGIGTARRNLVFAGHTDVVPPGDVAAWPHPPFSGDVATASFTAAARWT